MAALFCFLSKRVGAAIAAFLFQKFNFFEICKLYYNYMMREFALKAKSFFFWKGNFEGEAKNYFMIKAKAIFCAVFLFVSFVVFSQENVSPQADEYSKLLKSEKAKDRLDAVYALAISSMPESAEMLISAYKVEKDAYIKTQIIDALSVKNSTVAATFIIDSTQDSNVEVRKTAWNSINESFMINPDMADIVRKNFKKEKNVSVKFAALRAFCMDGSTIAVKDISSFILNSREDKDLRKAALIEFSKIKSKSVRNELKKISKNKDKELAREAAKILEGK